MKSLQQVADEIADRMESENGSRPTVLTVHPSTDGIEDVVGYTIKLDPECPIGKAYLQ